jgi:hypothetical protein
MSRSIPAATLKRFAEGKLSPEEALRVLDEIEQDTEASEKLDREIALADRREADFERSEAVKRFLATRPRVGQIKRLFAALRRLAARW